MLVKGIDDFLYCQLQAYMGEMVWMRLRETTKKVFVPITAGGAIKILRRWKETLGCWGR